WQPEIALPSRGARRGAVRQLAFGNSIGPIDKGLLPGGTKTSEISAHSAAGRAEPGPVLPCLQRGAGTVLRLGSQLTCHLVAQLVAIEAAPHRLLELFLLLGSLRDLHHREPPRRGVHLRRGARVRRND